jgi:outer membrane protein insertion porin family
MHLRPRSLAVLAALMLSLAFPLQALAEAFRITDIRVEGLQRIAAGTVFNYLPVKPGDEIDTDRTPEIIRALYKSGFFKDVRLEREGGVLIIQVIERPAIGSIDITGNKSIDKEELLKGLKEIGLAVGRTFNRSVLDKIEQELRRQYFNLGKYAVKLTSNVSPLERNRVAVTFEVSEGETARIKRINIVGNQRFEEEDLLKEFELQTDGWFTWFTKDDQYSKQKLSGDLEKLRSYYLNRGHVNFRIASTQVSISPDRKDIFITINIDEGEVFTLSDIKLAGELVVDAEEIFPLIHLRRGEAFSRKQVVESSDRVSQKLADLGYAFANVNSIPEIDNDKKTVAITFFVDPGNRVYVRRVNIRGNDRSRDRVIRREIRQQESAWFSSEKVKLSRERLQRLGYFEDVTIETPAVPGSTDLVDVNVDVTEKPSGAFIAGLGYSQSGGITFNTSVTQENFLGTGKRVSFAFNNSEVNTRYLLSYINPYYTVDGISRGFNLSYHEVDYEDLEIVNYATDTGLAEVLFGIPLSEFNSFNFGFGVEHIDLRPGSAPPAEVDDFIATYGTEYLNFLVKASWRHDSRDSALFPTRGAVQVFGSELSVPGSDLTYFKISYSHRRYFPLSRVMTLSLNGEVGYGLGYGDTDELPIYENYFVGGPGSVRGFRTNSLGPRGTGNNDPLGGNLSLVGNAELLFPSPILSDAMRLAVFIDAGNVFNTEDADISLSEFRYSAGVGASWLSPLGAMTISLAYPLNEKSGDETEVFQFNFGTTF